MTDANPQPAASPPGAPLTADQDKLWASLAHFGGVLWILPSLLIFLILKDRGAKTRVESKEALNFQITFLIIYIGWSILSAIITVILAAAGVYYIGGILTFIGFLIWIANVIFSILGGVKVQGGGSYRYPFSFRFIK
jgi:uncharacterized Tic20 family protein